MSSVFQMGKRPSGATPDYVICVTDMQGATWTIVTLYICCALAVPHAFLAGRTRYPGVIYSESEFRPPEKRGSAVVILQRTHSSKTSDQQLFDRLFRLFDMNENNLIERNEFRAMLLLLGIIQTDDNK